MLFATIAWVVLVRKAVVGCRVATATMSALLINGLGYLARTPTSGLLHDPLSEHDGGAMRLTACCLYRVYLGQVDGSSMSSGKLGNHEEALVASVSNQSEKGGGNQQYQELRPQISFFLLLRNSTNTTGYLYLVVQPIYCWTFCSAFVTRSETDVPSLIAHCTSTCRASVFHIQGNIFRHSRP